MPTREKKFKFSFKLANGLVWQFIAFNDTIPWAKKLARIMQLRNLPRKRAAKIFILPHKASFDPIKRLPASSRRNLPAKGWIKNKGAFSLCWSHPKSPHTIFELLEYANQNVEIIRMWLALTPIYKRAIESGGLSFHAGLIAKNKIALNF